MRDGIIKGEGNSRILKGHNSIPTTYADFRSALLAGTLLIDLLYNAEGWDVEGTPLNKANLLTDTVATALGLTSDDPTVNEALNAMLAVATQVKDGLMSAADKTKLDGVAENANNYVHPTTAGNKHIPPGGAANQFLKYSASGTAAWASLLADIIGLKTTTASLLGESNVDAALASLYVTKTYGYAAYTDSVAASSTLTKYIAIGSGKRFGKAVICGNESYGLLVEFCTDNLKTLMVGVSHNGSGYFGSANSRRVYGMVAGDTITDEFGLNASGNGYIGIDEVYISGTNIVIVFHNKYSSAKSLNTVIDWEVW